VDEQLRTDCNVLNIDLNQLIPPQRQTEKPKDYELWPDFATAWNAFTACATQWRWLAVCTGMGGGTPVRTGLDRSALLATLQLQQVRQRHWPQVLDAVAVLENEALRVWQGK
jgi:hypothetical protein